MYLCASTIYPSNAHKCVSYVVFHGVKSAEDRVKLIQLPRGSLERLSKALGVDRVGIFGLTKDTEGAQPLFDLINENVKDIEAPWLTVFSVRRWYLINLTQSMCKYCR